MQYLKTICLALITLSLFSCKKDVVAPTTSQDDGTYRYLALGDSYTIGESVSAGARFPVQLADSLTERGYDVSAPKIIATTGWTTGNLLDAVNDQQPDDDYELVTLLIGVNNQYQGRSLAEYREEFAILLDKAIGYARGNKDRVIVVSIPDYGYTPFGSGNQEQISSALEQFNNASRSITEDAGVTYVNITPISQRGLDQPRLVASDGLHPSGLQYALWVEQIVTEAEQILTEGP